MTTAEIVNPPDVSLSHSKLMQKPDRDGACPEKNEESNDSEAKSLARVVLFSESIISASGPPSQVSKAVDKGGAKKFHAAVRLTDQTENFSSLSAPDRKAYEYELQSLPDKPGGPLGAGCAVVAATAAKQKEDDNGAFALPDRQQVKEVRGSATVVRPNPNRIKTTLPIVKDGVALVAPAPKPVPSRSEQKEGPQVVFSLKTSLRDNEAKTGSTEAEKKVTSTSREQQTKKPWCEEASVQARRDKEELRKNKQEEQRRRQRIQTNFPVNIRNMPPTSGRASADGDREDQGDTDQYRPQHEDHRTRQHPQSRSQQPRVNLRSSSELSNGGMKGDEEEAGSRAVQPTPLFERLVTEEVQELKAYARIIENQSRQLSEREKVYSDLEVRLEVESRRKQQLEATLEARENQWEEKFRELEADRDHWKEVVQSEQTKNSRLIDQVMRKDQDIHRMLQRKVRSHCDLGALASWPGFRSHFSTLYLQFDHEGGRSVRNIRQTTTADHRSERPPSGVASSTRSPDIARGPVDQHKSPHEILFASGSAEKVRTRNAAGLLMDFFAM